MVKARMLTTIILVENIHCASCVSHITALLAQLRPAVRDVEVNILALKVRVVHDANLSIAKLCTVLDEAAFEVFSATSRDDSGKEIATLNPKGGSISYSQSDDNGYRPSVAPLKGEPGCLTSPKKTLHAKQCDACKKEVEAFCDMACRPVEEDSGNMKPGTRDSLGAVAQSKLPSTARGTLVEPTDFIDLEKAGSDPPQPGDTKWKASLSIGGMTCASCTSAIDHGLSELSFVDNVNVSLMTNSAAVVFTGRDNIDKLVEIIEDLGYDCSVERSVPVNPTTPESTTESAQQRSITLRVDGMFCKHCPPRILDALQATYGDSVTIKKPFSPAEPIIDIAYSPNSPVFTIRDLVTTIDSVNMAFKTKPYHPPTIEEKSQAMQRHEQRRLLARLFFSFIVAIPTFLIGAAWMSLVPAANSLRHFFDQPIWSGTVARRDWALLILATPVMFLAADVFHKRALKEVRALWRRGSRVPIMRRLYRFGSMNLLISAGTSVAYFSSIATLAINAASSPTTMKHSSTYFDSVVFLTLFILIGRWLEVYSKAKTGNAVAMLGKLKPQEAILVKSPCRQSVSDRDDSPPVEKPSTNELPTQTTETIDIDLLEVDDVVLVRHGSSPPADGVLVARSTKFNESSLSGEAKPVTKQAGDKVYAGAINVGDAVHVRVTELGGASMLDQIVAVVREGQTKRAPVERVVDVVTGYFVPVITALAIITWVTWLSLGESGALSRKYLGDSQQGGWAFWSLEFAIAVFVVACPCGIGLAAPTALCVGSGLAAKHGILVRGGGEAFQEASNVDAVVFDKTGTLTEGGNLKVTNHEILVSEDQARAAWTIAKALEETSSHPIARAIFELASTQPMDTSIMKRSIVEEPGKGLRGFFESKDASYEAALGSEALICSLLRGPCPIYFITESLSRWKTQAKSVAVLALRRIFDIPNTNNTSTWTIAAIFATTDPIRESALPALSALRSRNIPIYMLTGDNLTTASAVASTLSIPQDQVFAGVLPTEKADKIRWLQDNAPRRSTRPGNTFFASRFTKHELERKSATSVPTNDNNNTPTLPQKNKAIIAFIGDGINDAPALTTASVSISLACSATDIALLSSSFILLSPRHSPSSSSSSSSPLTSLITLLDISRRVFRRVKFNFLWACLYNILLVPVAAGCLFWIRQVGDDDDDADDVGWRMGPVWASAAMAASSICVVLSSLALRLERF